MLCLHALLLTVFLPGAHRSKEGAIFPELELQMVEGSVNARNGT